MSGFNLVAVPPILSDRIVKFGAVFLELRFDLFELVELFLLVRCNLGFGLLPRRLGLASYDPSR